MAMTGNFERFHYFSFETSYPKNQSIFGKLEFNFLFESTPIESATLLYKTAPSKGSSETNKIKSTKSTYHKE